MTTEGKSNPLALVGLLTLTLIWSYSWIAMKQVTLYIGAFDFTALRCICGALLLFLVLLLRGRGMRPTPFGYTLAIALLQTCGMIGLAQWALMSGGAGKVAILTYTMPFWVVIMAALFLGERMRRLQYVAIGVAAVGLCLVMQPWLLPAGIASLSTLAVPVFGVLFSWWLLGEKPDGLETVGIVLIVCALAVISLKKRAPQVQRSR